MTPSPLWRIYFVPRSAKLPLATLLEVGLTVPTVSPGTKVTVRFKQVGVPFEARPGQGWQAVLLKSSLGATSTLLLESEGLSGLLRLKR